MLSRKAIAADPLAALEKIAQDIDTEQHEALVDNVALRQRYIDSIKVLSDKKGQCSRLIGERKKRQEAISDLIDEMKAVSQELKELDEKQKAVESTIFEFFEQFETLRSKQEKTKKAVQKEWQVPLRWQKQGSELNVEHVEIKRLSVEHESAWQSYVDRHPAASLYHLLEWRDVVVNSFGHNCLYLIAVYNDTLVGVLPLVQLHSRLFGNFLVSQAFFNYGGALGDSEAVENKLMSTAAEEAKSLGCSHIEYRDDFQRASVPARTDKVSMMLALPDSSDQLWQDIGSKLRAQIKRPQRENCEYRIGGLELLDDFYHVFAINMRDLGTPVYAKYFFANIINSLGEKARLVIIYKSGQPVASAFLIGYRDVLEIPWASTLRSVNHLGVNMLLYWHVLKFAIERKYRWFDFGRSTVNAGTYRFKRQWGARPRQLYWHYWLSAGGDLPEINPNNPKYTLLIKAWKLLPVSVSKIIGPLIVKNLP